MIERAKYSCLIYGEGKSDKNFLKTLIDLPKFKFYTKKWHFNYGNASGGAAEHILDKCYRESRGISYDLVLCFIDLDKLKEDFSKKWQLMKLGLECRYERIKIIWQMDNLEDEFKKVIGDIGGKKVLNDEAKNNISKFVNSGIWKRIIAEIKRREGELEKLE